MVEDTGAMMMQYTDGVHTMASIMDVITEEHYVLYTKLITKYGIDVLDKIILN
jgi:hypothetical protein